MLRGGRLLERDVWSAVDCFMASQASNGRIYDFVLSRADNALRKEENWETWVRVPLESDVEYRFVKAAYLAWQATGDVGRLDAVLPACDRALMYSMTHPWRWDSEHGLIKRPYTIDTWDFDYRAGRTPWLNFAVDEHTFWGITHSDNSGFYESARLLAMLYEVSGNASKAEFWRDAALGVRERANALLFNGRFYRHFFKLTPVTVDGVDEEDQLSLSNPMAINRGLATHEIAVAILEEYIRRGATTDAFAPWFSIDPPFPDGIFGDDKLIAGAYINGGIFPLAGGELARAAFEHGFERYGLDTLKRYARMIEETGETYLWYFPDGSPSTVETSTSPDAMPTDGWGSTAMLYALLEGLCGVVDEGHSFQQVSLSPRWAVAEEDRAFVKLRYEASGADFEYRYDASQPGVIVIECKASATDVRAHLLLPPGFSVESVRWNNSLVPFETTTVGSSRYADFSGSVRGSAVAEVRHAGS
jgi:hypothetical protein